ncbi:MAG: peptidoglycan DD-metalloendopeptidase family protein [Gammaproteobacteria bacterium]|nr:peptidoglycan DD-metalloendopeptidase family protein [Gammaproteobacteria bacterium]
MYILTRHVLLLLSLLVIPFALPAANLPEALNVPGGVALESVEARDRVPPEVSFADGRVAVVEDGEDLIAVVGIPLDTQPGEQWLDMRWPNGVHARQSFMVEPKNYETQYLTITDERKVEPLAEDLERIYREQAITSEVLATWTPRSPDFAFSSPVEGPISSVYGLRRFYNNQPRSPHSGLDIAAAKGTPIRAPAAATVIHTGEFFFSGNVVYLSHGQGLTTMYAHMTEIKVEKGQQVSKGDVIGTIGQTGRVTGPHLHWGVYLNSTPVDPTLFLGETPP